MKRDRAGIAVVTGASSGLGRDFVRQLAEKYPLLREIWVAARRKEELRKLQDELPAVRLRILPLDLSDPASFRIFSEKLEQEQPCIKILVNAAGVGYGGHTEQQTTEEICRMLDINCRALFCITRLSLPYMNRGSRIIQVASGSAFAPQPGFAVYAASKACVLSFSRALREELRAREIYITAVCPGPVKTAFFENGGIQLSPVKKIFLAEPERVVRKAIRDSEKGKTVSVYGFSIRFVRVIASVLPQGVMSWLSGKIF